MSDPRPIIDIENLKKGFILDQKYVKRHEVEHNETYKMASVPSEVSDQPAHPCSLISLLSASKKPGLFGYPLRALPILIRLNAQVDLSLCWVQIIL